MTSINLNALFLLIVAACYMWHTEAVVCNPYTGPNGARHCVKFSNYYDYQWATCRSDAYIRLTTNGRHRCAHTSYTYCYYQCMIKNYEADNGQVLSSCRCDPNSASQKGIHVIVVVLLLALCFLFMI